MILSSAVSIILVNEPQKGEGQINDVTWHHSVERNYFQIDERRVKSST